MLKVRDELDRYFVNLIIKYFEFALVYEKRKDITWIPNFNESEKIEIQNKLVEIVNGNLSIDSIEIKEIKYLFIEYFKRDSNNEIFFRFLKKDVPILHENVSEILNYLLDTRRDSITWDMLDKVIEIYPEAKKIFNDRVDFLYQYCVKYIDNCNLNQLYLLGSTLSNELANQYFELLLEKDVFHKLQFTEWNGPSFIIIKNKEFQRKFLQHYSGPINSNFPCILKKTNISLMIQFILDHEENYTKREIENLFEIIKPSSTILNSDGDLNGLRNKHDLTIDKIKKLLLTKDVTYLWQIDFYYKNFTSILECYMINQLQNDDNIKILSSIESPLTNEYLSLINNKNPEVRKKLYDIFYQYMIKKFHIENDSYNDYIKQLFIQFVDGKQIYAISKLKSPVEMIAFLKMRYWQLDLTKLTEEQIKNMNVKHVFKLERMIHKFYQNLSDEQIAQYHLLLVKCYLIFGFDKAKIVLESLDKINELEHLFDTIDTRNIKYDETGNLILNGKFIRMYIDIFKRKSKNSDAYKLFSDIYKSFDELIENLQKDSRTLPKIVKLYKAIRFYFNGYPPNYYRLIDQNIYIPNNELTNKNLKWYETMKLRYISNIPKVSGELNQYRYEMLNLDDPLALTVGKRTKCCFLLDGVSKTSLKHAMTKDNGRVFVVFDGDEVIAQSWVWRDGNIVCFDNVEATLSNQELSDCYVEAIQKMVMESKERENPNDRIKMVTIGINESDLKYHFTKQYPHIISKNFLNQFSPIFNDDSENNDIYSDARTEQCIIYQEPNFEIEDNNHLLNPIYLDQRPSVRKVEIENDDLFDTKLLLNSINYDLKLPLITDKEFNKVRTIYYNKDWYLMIYEDGSYLSNIYSIDSRAQEEYEKILETITLEKETVLVKK